jgi:hypothetical protein
MENGTQIEKNDVEKSKILFTKTEKPTFWKNLNSKIENRKFLARYCTLVIMFSMISFRLDLYKLKVVFSEMPSCGFLNNSNLNDFRFNLQTILQFRQIL